MTWLGIAIVIVSAALSVFCIAMAAVCIICIWRDVRA